MQVQNLCAIQRTLREPDCTSMDESVQLIGYRHTAGSKRRRRARGDCNGEDGPQMELVSDSELTNNKGTRYEGNTVFSDTCEELPSSRARLAASRRLLESQRSMSNKETTPLLNNNNGNSPEHEIETSFAQMNAGHGGVVLSAPSSQMKSSGKWPQVKKW